MKVLCDFCKNHVKKVGRLKLVKFRGMVFHLCKTCKKEFRIRRMRAMLRWS
jgi:hypothetical protein